MRAISDPDLQLQIIRENLNNATAARLARIEILKTIFLVVGFLAIGFVVGCFVNQHRTVAPVAPPPWWQTGGSI